MPGRSFNSNSYKYGFNGKEKVDEISGSGNSYDFDARLYDARLGRTPSQDPHSGKYPKLSPYSMFANNPILLIDKDGKDIGVSTTFNQDGSKIITITVTGKLINNSSAAINEDAMKSYANRLSDEIIKDYSMNVPGVQVIVKTDIKVATSEVQLTETDHAFRIVDSDKIPNSTGGYAPKGTLGRGLFGQNVVYLNKDILENEQAETGKFAGTGKTDTGDGTLERTGSHEVGHSANLKHSTVGQENGNLMHQTGQPNAGKEITKDQILKIEKDHNNGNLNKGQQAEPTAPKK